MVIIFVQEADRQFQEACPIQVNGMFRAIQTDDHHGSLSSTDKVSDKGHLVHGAKLQTRRFYSFMCETRWTKGIALAFPDLSAATKEQR